MLISGLNKTTLLDYPGRVAATVFTGGCNFRCPFCHNAGLVLSPLMQENYTIDEVLAFLKKRKRVLSGVCITGGEPTIQQDLPDFLKQIKELGFAIKLDTNGSHPKVLKELLDRKLIDAVAMDIKNSPDAYAHTIGVEAVDLYPIRESVILLKSAPVELEFRTTVVRELHTLENLQKICEWIEGSPNYFLQMFEDSGELLAQATKPGIVYHGYTESEMKEIVRQLNEYPPMQHRVHLRGQSS